MIPVADVSHVGEARRAVAALASMIRLDERTAGRVAIVATELASNVGRHGGGGRLLARAIDGGTGIELIAIDKGPGMADLDRAMRDGYSTGGTPGKGLGAVQRMSDVFDIFTQHGQGTAVLSRISASSPAAEPLEYGVVNVTAPGESVSGDGWLALDGECGPAMLVVDGLGHGLSAHQAATAAIAVARQNPGLSPSAMIAVIHRVLQSTRGAAVAMAEVDERGARLRFAGIGNVSCSVVDGDGNRSLASMNGIVGHEMRRVQEFTSPFPPGATFLMFSDGIATRWRLDQYPGLRPRHPALAAGVIYRDHLRGRDDATVIVARRAVRTPE